MTTQPSMAMQPRLAAIFTVVLVCMSNATWAQTVSMVFESTSGNIMEGEDTSFQCSAIGADTSTRDPRLEWRIKDTATGTYENVTHLATTVNNADTTDGDVTQTITFAVTPERVGKQLYCSAYDTPGAALSNSDSIADILVSTGLGDMCTRGDCGNLASECKGVKCVCSDGYYDTNGAQAGGTCDPRIALGEPCTYVPNACAAVNSQCISGVCHWIALGEPCTYVPNACAAVNSQCISGVCHWIALGEPCTYVPNACAAVNSQCISGVCDWIALGEPCTYVPNACAAVNSQCISGVCECSAGFSQFGDTCTSGTFVLDQGCTVGTCAVLHSSCVAGFCKCDLGYVAEGVTECRKPNLDEACESSVGCLDSSTGPGTTGAICPSGTCVCSSGYYRDGDMCNSQIILGGACTGSPSDECATANSACINGVCDCSSGFTQSGDTCTQDSSTLGQPCTAGSCSIPNSACLAGVCDCSPGYHPEGDTACREPKLEETCETSVGCQDTSAGAGTIAPQCLQGACACPADYYGFNDICYTFTLDQPCNATVPCTIPNSVCVSGLCKCATGYITVDDTTCRKPSLTETCVSSVGCQDTSVGPRTSAADCIAGTCSCPANNVAVDDICYKQGTVNQPCTVGVPDICTVANSLCSSASDTCVCASGYTLDTSTGQCVLTVNLEAPCSTSSPCTVPNSRCVNGFCECSTGYYPVGVTGCRLPYVDEDCSPAVGCLDTSFGPNTGAPECTNGMCVCLDGYNDNGNVCEKPYLDEDCLPSVGCNAGPLTPGAVAPRCISGVCSCPGATAGSTNVCNILNYGATGGDDDGGGLSTEAIAAIVIGTILFLLLAAILLICCCKYGICRKRDKISPENEVKPYIPSAVVADEGLHYYLKPAVTAGPIISMFSANKDQPRPHQLPTLDTEYLITDDDEFPPNDDVPPDGGNSGEYPPGGDNSGEYPPGGDNSGESPPGVDNSGESPPAGDNSGESPPGGGDAAGESAPGGDDTGGAGEGGDAPSGLGDGEDIVVIPGGESPMHCVDLYE